MTDVFVVGGGPVGLAAAIAAARRGLRVTLADSLQPPIDKACGEALLPGGLRAARTLGIELPAGECFTIRGIRFVGENTSVEAEFRNGPGLGVRRTALHRALAGLAESAGVDLRWGSPMADPGQIKAGWIVGADGAGSRVRACAQLEDTVRDDRRFGFRLHFRISPWTDFIEIHWADGCQIYVTPVAPNEVGVALISRDPKLRVREALQRFPVLASRFCAAGECSVERGGVTSTKLLRKVARNNVALVGDASGAVDAITAEGLSLGFHQALALAAALERGDLTAYESAHRRLGRRPRFMADFLLTMDRWPAVRHRALPALAAHPHLFEGMLAMHTGAATPAAFAANCLALGWSMATGATATS